MDLTAFRNDLHKLVDELIDKHLNGAERPSDLEITPAGTRRAWSYRWPNGDTEHYNPTIRYQVAGDFGQAEVLIGQTTREAWGRRDRGRVVVFGKISGASTYYPWSEFVQTDDGEYAAPLTDPEQPRKSLRDPSQLPPRFASAKVRRNDQLFRSIRTGPALRVVVPAGDHEAMIRHAYLVASQRGHI